MKTNVCAFGLLLAFILLLASVPAWPGTQNALVTGSVFDQNGAALAGVTVRLINANIGFSQDQATATDGSYTFSNVPPAENYVISVEKAGFATIIRPGIIVQVGEAKLELPPFLLQPEAQPGQQVKEAPAKVRTVSIDLVSTTAGGVVDSRALHSLPLVFRDFIDLALLIPGTYPVEQGSVLEGASLVVNGTRADMNSFLLDGADNNDYTINQSLPFQIVEAMQEFRVQASTSNAEFGRSGGAQINEISRSGTNQLHGTLFWFNRNSGVSANNFFSAYNGETFDQFTRNVQSAGFGNPLSDSTLAGLYKDRKPRVVQNQFGANIGGALVQDKLFGFFNWESLRVVNPRRLFERVPGLTLRSTAGGQDPIAVALYKLYPAANVPMTAFTDPNDFAFAVNSAANSTDSDNFLERIDWRLGSRDSMSFKHNILQINQVQAGEIPLTPTYPGSGTRVRGRNQNFSYNFVHAFTARTNNEFRFGWNRFRLDNTALDAIIDPASLGFQNLNFHNQGLPTISVGGSFSTFAPLSVLGSNQSTPSYRVDNVWSWDDNLSLARGPHTWKMGGEIRHVRLNVTNDALGRGLITFFSGPFVAANGTPDIASIARVSPTFGGGFDRAFSTQSFAGYLQDQWRVARNLTLNYGIRYEVNTAPGELRNRLVNFYPAVGGLMRANSNQVLDPFGNVIRTAGERAPRAGYHTGLNNWSPRLGFAWDPFKSAKTVVRGSYALIFDQEPLEPSVNMLYNPPFVHQDFSFFAIPCTPSGECTPGFTLENTFGINSPTSTWLHIPYSTSAVDPKTRTAYVHQYQLGIEEQLGGQAVLEVAYIGSAGRHLPRLRDISPCTPSVFFANPNTCFNFAANPFLFASILNQETTANSSFNSLQVRFDTHSFHGLQVRLHYQFARSIDGASSLRPQVFLVSPGIATLITSFAIVNPDNFAGANNISPGLSLRPTLPIITTRPGLPQNSSNLAGERGLSDFDVRQRFVAQYIYDVPKWAPVIGSGWELLGITTLQSGQPFTVFDDFFGTPFRPNVIGRVAIHNSNPNGAIDNGIIPSTGAGSAFKFPVGPNLQLLPGSLGRNTFIGPKLVNFDFSVMKNTHLGRSERATLQLRVEFFNLFNNTNFLQPISEGGLIFSDVAGNFCGGCIDSVSNPFFGKIIQARPAREIQAAIKLIF
jgi:hypothetical protein